MLQRGVHMCHRYVLLFISKRQNCADDVFIFLLKIKLIFSSLKGLKDFFPGYGKIKVKSSLKLQTTCTVAVINNVCEPVAIIRDLIKPEMGSGEEEAFCV